jgi:hypothetical protein
MVIYSYLLARLYEPYFGTIFLIKEIIRNANFRIIALFESVVDRKLRPLVPNRNSRISALASHIWILTLRSRLSLLRRIIDIRRRHTPTECPCWVTRWMIQSLPKKENPAIDVQ